mmetsp:Transcript_5914/g.20127  ORF Transcript_5914/g.20127 Transcript_5914/m.20127 type:complete len:385 (-) Transcript_5914:100-1254(-)
MQSALGTASALRGRKIAVFLDYDGTLTPIVSDPDQALITEEGRRAVGRLSLGDQTAIVTGRSTDKVKSFLKLDPKDAKLYYAGSHGLHICGGADSIDILHPVAVRARASLEAVRDTLQQRLAGVPGFHVEDNVLCISAHYRNVADSERAGVAETVARVLDEQTLEPAAVQRALHDLSMQRRPQDASSVASTSGWGAEERGASGAGEEEVGGFPRADGQDAAGLSGQATRASTPAKGPASSKAEGEQPSPSAAPGTAIWGRLQAYRGKCVHEIKPICDWHKGKAVEWLYAQMAHKRAQERAAAWPGGAPPEQAPLVPIYIGDDVADEHGFEAVKRLHPEAIAVKVTANDADANADPTAADYTLASPVEVIQFLQELADRDGSTSA